MNALNTLNFAPVLITDVFDTMKAAGKWFDLSKARFAGDRTIPYVARTGGGNGVSSYLPHQGSNAPNAGNAITIGVSTSTVFYQPVPFYTSKEIQVLRHSRLSANSGPVLVAILRGQMGKFQWGNGASLERLRATRIMVPVTTDTSGQQAVDWDGMDRLGSELLSTIVTPTRSVLKVRPACDDTLPDLRFEPINVLQADGRPGIFRAHKGRRLITAHRQRGTVPFVGAARTNNSIVDYAATETRFPGGWLTLIYNGDGGTGHAKYQPVPFNASDDVIALEPLSTEATEEALLLLACLLTQQCVSKFSFGYKLTLHRLGRQKLMVPVTTGPDGDTIIDWNGMTTYGRAVRARVERRLAPVLSATP